MTQLEDMFFAPSLHRLHWIYIPLKLFLVHVICLQNFCKLNLQARNFFQDTITSCCSTEFRECVVKFFFFLNVKSVECISFSLDNQVAKSRKQIVATWDYIPLLHFPVHVAKIHVNIILQEAQPVAQKVQHFGSGDCQAAKFKRNLSFFEDIDPIRKIIT